MWIPGFRGNFAYGDINIEGEDGMDPVNPQEPPGGIIGDVLSRVFSERWYLKFFFITRLAYENDFLLMQLDGLGGAIGGSVKFLYNYKEIVQANFQTINFRFFGGYKFINYTSSSSSLRYELIGYLGGRFYFQKIYSDLNQAINKIDINPSWTEPIIGIQNQLTLKRWLFLFQADYGGYFVRSKSSWQISSSVLYKSGKHINLKLGWNYLDLNHHDVFLGEGYVVRASFSGPMAGIGFEF